MKCWGYNVYGELGDGTTTDRSTPVDVIGLNSVVSAMSAGYGQTCALTNSGGMKCWGDNAGGQLGDGTQIQRTIAVDVTGLTSGVSFIATGVAHSCAVTVNGGLKCWGANDSGILGDGTTIARLTPVSVLNLFVSVSAVTATGASTCALTSNGGVKCWGSNQSGQLGDGTTTTRLTAVDVTGLASGVVAMAMGGSFACALTSAGGVKCWGNNTLGQLGVGNVPQQLTPVNVLGLTSGVSAIAAGATHACALTTAGGVKCWGANTNGVLGNGTTDNSFTAVDVVGLSGGVSAISAGGGNGNTCALTNSGGVKCWGDNQLGQLGNGTVNTFSPIPVDVISLVGIASQSIAFAPLANKLVTDGPFTVAATGGASGNPVTFTAQGVCGSSGANGATITLTGAPGICTISANQAGNANYLAAPPVQQSFNVSLPSYTVAPSAGANGTIFPSTVVLVTSGQTTMFTVTANGGYVASVTGSCNGSLTGSAPNYTYTTNAITTSCTVAATFDAMRAPSAPLIGSATPGDGQATISFAIPSDGGSPITTYSVTCNPGQLLGSGVASPITVTGLSNGTTYSCSATATNAIGMSAPSASLNVRPFGLPGAPTIGSPVAGNTLAAIFFAPPTLNGGLPITGYKAICNPGGVIMIGAFSPVTFTGLANDTTYICSVAAINSAGTGSSSGNVSVTPSASESLVFTAAMTRKTHGNAGIFNFPIDLAQQSPMGPVSVEPRNIGAGHVVAFQFNSPIASTGTVIATDYLGANVGSRSAVVSGNEVIVTLTDIPDGSRVHVLLTDVNSSGINASAWIAFLLGDANSSRAVNSADISAVKAHTGQATTVTSFKFDLDASGSINAADLSIVKSRSGRVAP